MDDSVITLPDGRSLEITQAGDPTGFPVVIHHGTPASRALHPAWDGDAATKGARLISFNRAGYGGSTRKPGRSVADVAADVAALADALGVERFATWGLSGGGPHALATAALLPERVVSAASLASVAPWDAEGLDVTAGMGEDNVQEFGAAVAGEDALVPFLSEMRGHMLAADAHSLIELLATLLSDVDVRALDGKLGDLFYRWGQEGLGKGIEGWLDDDLAFVQPWGFELERIEVPVLLWQGREDRMVPSAHGEWLAKQIPGVDARLHDDEGHLSIATSRMPETLDWLLSHNR